MSKTTFIEKVLKLQESTIGDPGIWPFIQQHRDLCNRKERRVAAEKMNKEAATTPRRKRKRRLQEQARRKLRGSK